MVGSALASSTELEDSKLHTVYFVVSGDIE